MHSFSAALEHFFLHHLLLLFLSFLFFKPHWNAVTSAAHAEPLCRVTAHCSEVPSTFLSVLHPTPPSNLPPSAPPLPTSYLLFTALRKPNVFLMLSTYPKPPTSVPTTHIHPPSEYRLHSKVTCSFHPYATPNSLPTSVSLLYGLQLSQVLEGPGSE